MTRDCMPHESSFATAHVNPAALLGHMPFWSAEDTMSSVSQVVPVQVSTVKDPPAVAEDGTVRTTRFSPVSAL